MNAALAKRFDEVAAMMVCHTCHQFVPCVKVDLLMDPIKTVYKCRDCLFGKEPEPEENHAL